MPSSNKTSYLGLNKFIGTDKPKMADFNEDNRILDTRFQAHEESKELHLTPEVLAVLAKGDFVLGSYVGNGVYRRTIPLDFQPAFGMLFPVGQPPLYFDANTRNNAVFSGFFSRLGCSPSLSLKGEGLAVEQYQQIGGDMKSYYYNQQGVTYVYIAWKEKA